MSNNEAPEIADTRTAVGGPVQRMVRPLIGCDDLREWLVSHGFRCAEDSIGSRDNECNWYAYRRSAIPARECECNDGKPMHMVVKPHKVTHHSALGGAWESVEVDVTGEAGGVWFKLQAYSLKHEELRERLVDIESSLIAAWNALRPNVEANAPVEGAARNGSP